MKIEHVPKVVLVARMAALLIAFFLITVGLVGLGLILALIVLIVGLALRHIKAKAWLIEKLTGLPREAVVELDRRRKAGEPIGAPVVIDAGKPMPKPQTLSQAKLNQILEAEKQEGIALRRVWPLDAPADQNSWLGGVPKLPEAMDWPVNPETGLALHHLAQIDLSEMPRPKEGPQLPERGTLFFFADINESMDWAEGPDMPEAAVLYAPDATADVPLRQPPDNLPEIDHRETEMESEMWGFRTPVRKVHGRWPVTGHLIDTWDEDSDPEGLRPGSGYYEARLERTKAVRDSVLGVAPEQPRDKPLLKQVWGEKKPGGKGHELGNTYHPENYGPGFPFTAAVAMEVLRFAIHKVRADYEYSKRSIDVDRKRERPPGQFDLDRIKAAEGLLPEAEALLERFGAMDPAAPVSSADRQAFETFIRTHAQSSAGYTWLWRPTAAIQRVLTRGIYDRALLQNIPDEAIARLAHISHPGQDNARHYMLGAKGTGSNATAGRGVRLLQLDSDYAVEFMFCDVGIVDFWIDENDLAAGRWDRAWAATAGG